MTTERQPEKLCIFCKHFRWKKEEMWGMGGTMTGPMMEGGDATCDAGQFAGGWGYQPADESEFRRIILRATSCDSFELP